MRIFRRRKKDGNYQGPPIDSEPLPDIVYQMGAEAAARYVRLRASSPNPHDPMFLEAAGGVYEVPKEEYENEVEYYDESYEPARSSSTDLIASAFGFKRPKASKQRAHKPPKEGRFVRAGSPAHFQQRPPGTPVHFHHRAASPDFAQERVGSPYHFAQQQRVGSPVHFGQQQRVGSPVHFAQEQQQRVGSPVHFAQNARPSSPEIMRRLQRAQHSQEIQHVERQQRRQQQMMMAGAIQMAQQYPPYGQQAYYPNMQPIPIIQAPQMYQYY